MGRKMKYIRIIGNKTDPEGNYAILKGDEVILLDSSPLNPETKERGVVFPLKDVKKFLPPIQPPNIIALGLNYKEHAEESKMKLPSAPVIFLKSTSSLIGHLQPIILPKEAPAEVDYEAELCIVIGKIARNVSQNKAVDCILGYTCGNDVSARDCQLKTDRQWARGKSFDTFAPAGPVIETELNISNLRIRLKLNGKVMQDATTSDLIFNIPEIVSFLSKQMTLLPGTLIMTGTPSGVGFARKPPVFLKPGDVVEVEIQGVGTLKNPVIMET